MNSNKCQKQSAQKSIVWYTKRYDKDYDLYLKCQIDVDWKYHQRTDIDKKQHQHNLEVEISEQLQS